MLFIQLYDSSVLVSSLYTFTCTYTFYFVFTVQFILSFSLIHWFLFVSLILSVCSTHQYYLHANLHTYIDTQTPIVGDITQVNIYLYQNQPFYAVKTFFTQVRSRTFLLCQYTLHSSVNFHFLSLQYICPIHPTILIGITNTMLFNLQSEKSNEFHFQFLFPFSFSIQCNMGTLKKYVH